MLYRIDGIINLVRSKSTAKSLKKMFNKDVLQYGSCQKDDVSYNYFKFIQLLKKEHSEVKLSKFVNEFYETIDDEYFKEIIGILVLKFWGLVYGIVKDKFHSQLATPFQGDQDVPESLLEVSFGNLMKIVAKFV